MDNHVIFLMLQKKKITTPTAKQANNQEITTKNLNVANNSLRHFKTSNFNGQT